MKTAAAGDRTTRSSGFFRLSRRPWLLERLLPRHYDRRRRILVNLRYQLKTALVGVAGMALLAGLTGLILHRVNLRSAREILAADPLLQESLKAKDGTQLAMLIVVGLLAMAGFFFFGIVESRKTAGAILNVRRRLEEIRAGRLQVRAILRRGDDFPELASAFNEMAEALRARTEGELATLGRLSAQASELLKEDALGNREGVRRIAGTLRQSLEDARRRKEQLLEP
jgi:methyl-accepting chemotaxis protein